MNEAFVASHTSALEMLLSKIPNAQVSDTTEDDEQEKDDETKKIINNL